MNRIQNSCIGKPTPFNKAIAGFTCVLTITLIALSIIGLASSGHFNAIVQFDAATNGFLLGTSFFVLILDLVWIAVLCKKTKEHSVSQSALIPEVEEINCIDYFSQVPQEIIIRVFGYLSASELAKNSGVNRSWKKIASDATLWKALDLRKISPLLKVFDESDWAAHVELPSFGLEVGDISPLDKRIAIPILKKCISSLPIEGNAGVTLLTLPKGLTFNKLVKLARSPKIGNITPFRFIWAHISNDVGDIPVDKTHRIVITNNVFEESRNLSFSNQKALVNKIDCEIPKVLEATALLVVTFMSSGERLYNDNPWTYTRCTDHIAGFQSVVGGFSPNGASGILPDGIAVGNDYCIDHNYYYGVGGVLR